MYRLPAELQGLVVPGSLVEVPFGARAMAGYVVALCPTQGDLPAEKIRDLVRVVESQPVWGQEMLELADWIWRLYGSTWQEALQTVVPAPVLARLRGLPTKPMRKRKSRNSQEGLGAVSLRPTLTAEQSAAVAAILEGSRSGRTSLLFGVTGSGKTEVYLHAVEQILAESRGAIVMVPEVSLTPQAVDRYRGRLGETVGVLHSALTDAERRRYWGQLRDGQLRVALGTRSAGFAPLRDLGLVILDEEHDSSYKQDQSPRYHARQVANWRKSYNRAGLVLGSATPSLESFFLAQRGQYQLLSLPTRATGAALPSVECVDMRRLRMKDRVLSPILLHHLRQCMARGEQAVLLYNRRGFSHYVQCTDCGHVVACRNCSISLAHHGKPPRLSCHYCDYQQPIPDLCPSCNGSRLQFKGAGTERVEHELAELLPAARVARMDRDTTTRPGSHAEILGRFGDAQADILLGTQMVAKGLDFPRVTLVGVLAADAGLHLPDFRAGERTFQLLTQVAGRAGRADLHGHVVVQAFDPEHPSLQAALRHDYLGFYGQELELRRMALYPPFCRLLRVLFWGADEKAVEAAAQKAGGALLAAGVQVVGPAACPIERIREQYRWHFIVKGERVKDLGETVRNVLDSLRRPPSVRFAVDLDPQSLL